MRDSFVRCRWSWAGVVLLLIMAAGVLGVRSVRADDEGAAGSRGTVEVTLSQDATTYAAPDPASAVLYHLSAGETVSTPPGARVYGADGTVWLPVYRPSGESLGWMRLSDFQSGAAIDRDILGNEGIPPSLPFP